MTTGGRRDDITDVIFSILTNVQTTAGTMIGAGASAVQKQQASGATAGSMLGSAKKRLLENSLVKVPTQILGQTQKMSKSLLGRLGIQFSLASILKQSQIFTGILGSVFQIFGAMVDVFLAPLMPFFIRTLRGMVNLIPYAQEKGEQFAQFIERIATQSTGILDFLSKFMGNAIPKIAEEIIKIIKEVVSQLWSQITGSKRAAEFAVDVASGAVIGSAVPGVGTLAGGIIGGVGNLAGLTRPHQNRGVFENEEQEKKTNDVAYQGNFNRYFETEVSTQETWNN